MDDVIDDLIRVAKRCEGASRRFEEKSIAAIKERANKAVDSVGNAWSGGWLGYHSRVYTSGLRPKRPGEHFDTEMGTALYNETRGEWREYDYDTIYGEILKRARLSKDELNQLETIADGIESTFDESKSDLLPTLDAVLRSADDASLREVREKIDKLRALFTAGFH